MPAGLDPNRYRVVAWIAVMARLAGVIFFVGFQAAEYHMLGYFDLVFFVPESLLLCEAPLMSVISPPTSGLSLRCCSSWPHSVASLPTTDSSERSPRPYFAVRRRALPVWVGRHRSRSRAFRIGSGSCCRACSRNTCPDRAATRRSACSRRDWPRDADRSLEGHRRIFARRHQLRHVSCGELSREAGRCPDDLSRSGIAPDRRAGVPAVSHRLRSDPRFTAATHHGGDRQEHAAAVDRPAALSFRDHSGHQARTAATA